MTCGRALADKISLFIAYEACYLAAMKTNYDKTFITLSPAGVLKWPDTEGKKEVGTWQERWFQLAARSTQGTAKNATQQAVVALFWENIAAACITALCRISNPDATQEHDIPLVINIPLPDEADDWLHMAPPMPGGEYLSYNILRKLWQSLLQWCAQSIQKNGSIHAFLQEHAPQWQQVGRVFFHLAENKLDADHPFAFMSTFTVGLNEKGQPRHMPLAAALRQSAEQDPHTLVRLLVPVHTASQHVPWISQMVHDGSLYKAVPLTPKQAHAFLESIPLMESSGLGVRMPDWWKKRPKAVVQATVDVEQRSALGAHALLDMDIGLALGDEKLTEKEMDELLALSVGSAGIVFFKNTWVEVDTDKINQALAHWRKVKQHVSAGRMSFLEGMRLLAGMPQESDDASDIDEDSLRQWSHVNAGPELEKFLSFTRQEFTHTSESVGKPIEGLTATLRPYQVKGVQWLHFLGQLQLGACLADDMGLGKTLQILALLLLEKQLEGQKEKQETDAKALTTKRASKKQTTKKQAVTEQAPAEQAPEGQAAAEQVATRPSTLLVVPASLLGNWQAEIATHAPSLTALILHPSAAEMKNTTREHMEHCMAKADLVITTYGMCQRLPWLQEIQWQRVIADEAQAIKNAQTRQSKAVRALCAHTRIALTGTPIENRLSDLWALFDFLNPGLLGKPKEFDTRMKRMAQSTERFAPLRRLVSPYILRRMKTDKSIIQDLPDKTEMPLFCHLTKEQAKLYTGVTSQLKATLESLDSSPESRAKRRVVILQSLILLKQICNHPHQAGGHTQKHEAYDPALSGKFQRVAELCTDIAARQERVLVFTQFKEIIPHLCRVLEGCFGRKGLILHGAVPVKKRQELVKTFQEPDGPPFFVLSLKAGGTGLTLTAASHVIHVDRWWNPAVENQATDRAFRIGQKRNVLVHKCVTRGTLEEKIDTLLEEKKQLSDEVLGAKAELDITSFDDKALLDFVRLDITQF